MLRKYVADPSHILRPQEIEVTHNVHFRDEPLQIMDYKTKQLRNKAIPLVKVLWWSQGVSDMTWEPEKEMREQHPHLFETHNQALDQRTLLSRTESGEEKTQSKINPRPSKRQKNSTVVSNSSRGADIEDWCDLPCDHV
ncbi:PREDICTED: uncharacterized protein LOC104820401 [Tarenaya hassleriana]|uniref:uncharacterized protein LOC104820401 n=1 Tax=Tarenaya hassleriana TaxID=28532 RepID=UPI00053C7743|nr:PREDICTED: uncharacterized protein LOC104820401 [Tarenaya hassleriana]